MNSRNKTRPRQPSRTANAETIKELTQGKCWTQQNLATAARCSLSSVKQAWRGLPTTINILSKIAGALSSDASPVSVDQISFDAIKASPVDDTVHPTAESHPKREADSSPVGKLIAIATDILSNSDATRQLILEHNAFPDDSSAEQLANHIFKAEKPMTCLHNCVDREIDVVHRQDLNRCMPLLADALAPVCLSLENFEALQQYVDGNGSSTTHVSTKYELTARAAVGFVKGLPIDSRLVDEFDELCERDRPAGRDRIGGLPSPPESGRGSGKSSQNSNGTIVDAFRIGLSRLLTSASDELASVQSALRLAGQQRVLLCVLFRQKQSPQELDELNATFPELILLVSLNEAEPSDNHDVLNQIMYIRNFFNADRAES